LTPKPEPAAVDNPPEPEQTTLPIAVEVEAAAGEWIPEAEMWQKLGLPSKEALRKRRNRETLPDNVECRKLGKRWQYRFVETGDRQ
jgi:hypothetical protein